MCALEVIAKPVFGRSEADWLAHLRETQAYSRGSPEFTLVFPGSEFTAHDVVQHVEAVCALIPRIHFCLRSAIIVPDDLGTNWFHVFLVPDEGFGAVVRLHDRLHVGPLASCLRPEVPYIPHLTVASVNSLESARSIKAQLNALDLAISGRIDEVEVHQREAAAPRCIAKLALAHHGFFHSS